MIIRMIIVVGAFCTRCIDPSSAEQGQLACIVEDG